LRRPMIAGNWKMHKTTVAARQLATDVVARTAGLGVQADVVLAPPFSALCAVCQAVAGSAVGVAAQDMHWAEEGAYTGAVSPPMVAEFARYVILGHSERRAHFCETDGDVNRKTHAAFAHGLTPIVCVGETLAEREAGRTDEVVASQLRLALEGLAAAEAERLIVAYEPVWAIGSGLPCDPDEAARVSAAIRSSVHEAFGRQPAGGLRVLYGGSVKADNAASYLARADIDGALVGGASLDAAGFAAIVRAAG
jgi:triosephosphate isomerase (TIM)